MKANFRMSTTAVVDIRKLVSNTCIRTRKKCKCAKHVEKVDEGTYGTRCRSRKSRVSAELVTYVTKENVNFN
jgi:hypothetical protein